MFNTLVYILLLLVVIYFALSVLYLLVLAVWGKLFYRTPVQRTAAEVPSQRIAVLVPAYREDGIIMATARNLLQVNYPADLFDVYIIADSFQPQTLQSLRTLPLHVIEVKFDKSTKTRALNEAFSRIHEQYDIALVCDADNMLAPDCLQLISRAFDAGAQAVQARRVAKNMDSAFAVLDACSEAINNNIFRKGTYAMGLSSAVIGSGMAFRFGLLKEVMGSLSAVGGFDKVLQLNIVQRGIRIHYLENALVFDEKVGSKQAFQQQRKRWVSSQFIYLKQFLVPGLLQLFKGNLNYFNLAVVNNLILPRVFLLAILPMLSLIAYLLQPQLLYVALGVWLLYLLALTIALPKAYFNKQLLQSLLQLPRAAGAMFGNLFNMKGANNRFIHTAHTQTEINNPIFHEHGS
ncbi:glycosyltransferase [Deminuibacter soli]|uniref:Glycosyltransferase n=1 Tax=Deminuibacter soli TaxID=2291815 RepID=A0A3E1NQI2_9BACT|nr:glycosyltransferase family 2 protein [Deminuibacter soli]RFM30182.1 glycosyltransferase [Deminuibacter soli]